jgi:hypothetical protein
LNDCNGLSEDITSGDGLVGAIIPETEIFITSPNCTFIPFPPLGDNRDIFLRSDARFGMDDPIQYPQPYNEYFCHLPAIPLPPKNGDPYYSQKFMWANVQKEDFAYASRSSKEEFLADVWSLSRAYMQPRLDCVKECLKQLAILNVEGEGLAGLRKLVAMLKINMETSLSILDTTRLSLVDAQRMSTILQRSWLELSAILDYMQIYKPLMDEDQPGPSRLARTMGCFTDNQYIARQHMRAGLPVYLIRPWKAFNAQNVLEVVDPVLPDLQTDPLPPPNPVLFTGAAGSSNKYAAIFRYVQVSFAFGSSVFTPSAELPTSVLSKYPRTRPLVAQESEAGPARHAPSNAAPRKSKSKPTNSKAASKRGPVGESFLILEL